MTATGLLLRAACWIKPKTWPRKLARNSTATGVAICFSVVVGAAVLASGLSARAEEPKSGAEVKSGAATFEHDARPILKKYCLDCHGAGDELKANLDLRLKRLILKGGEAGAAIVPGKPAESLLIHRLKSGEMPPGEKKVTPDEIAKLERWIADGALTSRPEPEMLDQGIGITPEEREFWAFQPLRRITPPTQPAAPATLPGGVNADAVAASAAVTEKFTAMRSRLRSPVDAFVASTAAAQQLRFAPEADPRTLASRVLLDLLGLAPNQEQLDEFAAQVAAGEPDAYERLVDRALASPRYGERWGRHWLDIAGYADSDGYTNADSPRPYAYKYRDYVIKALNTDKAFDRFIVEQMAGDELIGGASTNFTPEQIELLTATGFLRMAADGTGSGAPDQDLARNQVMNDTLKIVASTFYGLTLQCAQCHNHRYDPILQSDFYRLRAVFEPAIDWKSWRNPQQRLVSLYTDADRAKSAAIEAEASKIAAEKNEKQAKYMAAALEKELMKHPEGQREALRSAYNTPADKRTPEQQKLLKENPSVNISPGVLYQYDAAAAEDLKKYDQRIAETRAAKPVEDFVQALVEPPGVNPTTFLFYRGDHRQPKGAIQPGDLTIATPPGSRFDIAADDPQLPTTGRRLALAKHMTSGQHPLVGRTLVNRIWMLHFGRGIVGTPSDFGALGERPTHPELLDWLATEWPARGWSLKQLHRTLLTSTVFRQASQRDPAAGGRDDDNRFFTRMPVRRLDAEVLRDRMLAAAGELKSHMFGPSVAVKEDDVGQVVVGGDEARRSVYIQTRRSQPLSMLTAFDAPVMETNCERRPASTVATQSLLLLNSEFTLKQALATANLVRAETERIVAAGPLDPARLNAAPETLSRAVEVERLQPARVWQCGYGDFDAAMQRTKSFQRLAHWTGSQWQAGPQLPDAAHGWVLLHASGGHTGEAGHAAIRRWTAPVGGKVAVKGRLEHPSENGDGVRGRLVSSRSGLAGEWAVKHGGADTAATELVVEAGDTIDFLVDCRENVTSDSFNWVCELTLTPNAGAAGQGGTWKTTELPGPPSPPLLLQIETAWRHVYGRPPTDVERTAALDHAAAHYQHFRTLAATPGAAKPTLPAGDVERQVLVDLCWALLTSNEFLYVD